MPLARIELEQIEGNRWVAEIEAGGIAKGGPNFKRQSVTAHSFEAILDVMTRVYYAQVPPQLGGPPLGALQAAVERLLADVPATAYADSADPRDQEKLVAAAEAVAMRAPDPPDLSDADKAALRERAMELGIDVNSRMSEARLREEIAEAEARRPPNPHVDRVVPDTQPGAGEQPRMPVPADPPAHDPVPAASDDPADPRDPDDNERIMLRREAEALGVDVDGRWGAARLRDEIEKAKA